MFENIGAKPSHKTARDYSIIFALREKDMSRTDKKSNLPSTKNVTAALSDVPLLPYPDKVINASGRMHWPPARTASWFSDQADDLPLISGELAAAGIRLTRTSPTKTAGAGLAIGEPGPVFNRLPTGAAPESYCIRIHPKGLSLRARSHAGLICGWQSVKQILATCGRSLPAGVIEDAPALSLRGFHLDLKGLKPKPAYLMELPGRLANFKINAVLLELEDYFQFKKHPSISHRSAPGPKFWQNFRKEANAHNIEIIPLLQTWGHLQYILRIPRYLHLAEAQTGMIGEICPLHPETWPLLRDMLDEICDAFPDSRYFHIGLDEIFTRGKCPRCRRRVAAIGMKRFVIEMLNQRFDYLASRGKVPMFWGSLDGGTLSKDEFRLIHNPLVIHGPKGSFKARAIGITGNYGMMTSCGMASSFAGGLGVENATSKELGLLEKFPHAGVNRRTIHQLEPELKAKARRYALTRNGLLKPAYEIAILQDNGFDAIGISAAQYSAGVMGLCPDFVFRQRNELAIAQWIKSQRAMGVIDTWWARGHTHVRNNAPFEAAWYNIASFADFAWRSAQKADIADFDRRWCKLFLGASDTDATDALYVFSMSSRRMSHAGRNFSNLARALWQAADSGMSRNKRFREAVDLGIEAQQLAMRVQTAQLEGEYLFATIPTIPRVFMADARKRLRELEQDIRKFALRIKQVLSPMMLACDVNELIAAEVTMRLVQIRHIAELLRARKR